MSASSAHQLGMSELSLQRPHFFFAGATHEEAQARLEYLMETDQRCGLLIGPTGTGKSTLLRSFVKESAATPFTASLVDIAELGPIEALEELAVRLGVTSHARGRLTDLWREISDALTGARRAKRRSLVIFDHLDRATADCQQAVRRLLAQEGTSEAATIVLAFSGRSFTVVYKEWRQLADLQLELTPLMADETSAFVQSWLDALELSRDVFDRSAMETLHRMSRGVPRDLIRLCELALLAAMDGETPHVSGDVVEAARRELSQLRTSA